LFFLWDIDNFFFIMCDWVKIFVERKDRVMNLFESSRGWEIIKSVGGNVLSVALVAVVKVANNIG
jgi:hypothetical protein